MQDGKTWQQAQADGVGRAIRDLRGDRSAQWVSDQTEALGLRVTRALITDLELGRRKYVAAHELALLSAALGVTPAVLLTWGQLPDGDVEVFPGRSASALEALEFWGGTPLPRIFSVGTGLPEYHPASNELVRASRERKQISDVLWRTQVGGLKEYPDPDLVPALRKRLDGLIGRIRELGGKIRESDGG